MTSVKKNFIYNILYQILIFLLPLVTTPYLARVLGAEKTGIYSFAHSVAYYFVLFAMLGLNNYGNREIARKRNDVTERSKTFWSIYFLQVCTGLVALTAYVVYCFIFKISDVVSWILALYVLSACFDINWFFWGLEEFKITVTRNTVIKLVSVAAILLLVKSKDDLYLYTAIMTLSNLLSPLLLWPYLKKRIKWYNPNWTEVIAHLKPNLVLFIPVIAISLYKVMDKIMLGTLATYSEVGYYEYSEKVIAIPIACVNALGTVMLPRMSNLVANRKTEEENSIIKKSIIVGAALAISMGFGLMGIAKEFVPFFYGNGYEKCVSLFYILMPSCAFLAVANVIRTQFLIPRKKDKAFIKSVILGAVVNLIINALLIPGLQSVGAAIGTLAAEATVCIYQLIIVRRDLPVGGYVKNLLLLLFFGSIMFLAVFFTPAVGGYVPTIAVKIVVGVIIFAVLFISAYRSLVRQLLKRG